MSYYIHNIPGRLRIKTPLIKKNQSIAEDVKNLLRPIIGISSTSFNLITGSIVINYNHKVITSKEIVNTLNYAGYFDLSKAITNDEYIKTAAASMGQVVVKTLFGTFIESALEGSALSFIAILV
ncbi:MAG: HMA2 domain-containing protein [Nitrospirota bacterium]